MIESLPLRIARQRVQSFEAESDQVMRQHDEAMDCRDCEAVLQLGINAYHWLIKVDQTIRRAVYSRQLEYDPEIESVIEQLFIVWLRPCGDLGRWVDVQRGRGFQVENWDEFRRCQEEVEAIVESFGEEHVLPPAMAELQDQALDEFHNGQTSGSLEGL